MAQALTALQRVAAGIETTGGTVVAATRVMPHITGSSFTETYNREKLDEARGVLAFVDDVVTQRMSALELQQQFDFDLCLLAFLCGVQTVAATGGTKPFTYSMAAGPITPAAKGSATFEVIQSDGAADRVASRFGHARPTSIGIEWNIGGTTSLATSWMGGAAETVSKAAIVVGDLSARRVVPASLWTVDIDDSWAGLGTTPATNVRALSWSLTTGLAAQSYHLRGRTGLDLDGWYDGRLELALTLTLDLDAAAAAEVLHWKNGDLRFVRLAADNGLTGTSAKSIQIDQAVRIIGSPDLLGSDGEQSTVAFDCELRSDQSGAADDFLAIELLSALPSWTGGALLTSTGLPPNEQQIAT